MTLPLTTAKATMDARELALLESEMRGRAKSMGVAYLLWFFLSFLGAHWFYLGRTTRGWAYVATFLIGVVSALFIVGIFILFVFSIVILVDLVRIYNETNAINAKAEADLITQIIAARQAPPPAV